MYDFRCESCGVFEKDCPTGTQETSCVCGAIAKRAYVRFPGVVFRGGGWAGKSSNPIMQKIETASLNHSEIDAIMDSGEGDLKRAVERKAKEMHAEKAHLDRLYGKDMFDGKDSNGQLVKNFNVSLPI